MHPRRALWLAAAAQGAGPFLFGVAVANTIGSQFIDADQISALALIAGLLGATSWGVFTALTGIPNSSSHTLIGSLMGAGIAQSGF
ncbi:MAG TPA: inorganic phosphate transporter, partial [Aggregatilineales bacterium]|nr:inorganic phosphate transporter [Aggregatilineales bacterium]